MQNTFTGSSGTALATYDAAWIANTTNDGLTGLQLDGSGNCRNTNVNAYSDVYYNGSGTGATSKARIIVAAGAVLDTARARHHVACRRHTTQLGYDIDIRSSTSLNTNLDRIDLLKNGVYVATRSVALGNFGGSAFDVSATPIDVSVQTVAAGGGGVDIQVVLNGRTITFASTGSGFDPNGETPLTGGYPGFSIHLNGGSATQNDVLITEFTDDVSAAVTGTLAATESGADVFAATGGVGNNGVRLTLRDTDTGALAADLTDVTVSIRSSSNGGTVLASSTTETTNGSGVLELASLAIGNIGDYVYVTVETDDNSIVATYRLQVIDLNA